MVDSIVRFNTQRYLKYVKTELMYYGKNLNKPLDQLRLYNSHSKRKFKTTQLKKLIPLKLNSKVVLHAPMQSQISLYH